MTVAFLLIAISFAFTVAVYRNPSFVGRLWKNIPITDWINLFVTPFILYLAFILIMYSILSRTRYDILFTSDFLLGAIILLLISGAFVGNSIHFVSKVLSRYIPIDEDSIVFQINEIFHMRLSHELTFYSTILLLFAIGLFEINYPLVRELTFIQEGILSGGAVIFALFSIKSYHHANIRSKFDYYERMVTISIILLVLHVIIFMTLRQSINEYQFNVFLRLYLGSTAVFYFLHIIILKMGWHKSKRLTGILNALNLGE